MTATDRKAMIEAEILANRLGKERGELVMKASVEEAAAAVFQLLNERYRSLSARLSKRMELDRDQIVMIDRLVERDLIDLARKFEELGGIGDATLDLPDDPAI